MSVSLNLFGESEEETLRRASEILVARQAEAEKLRATETARLYKKYAPLLVLLTAKEIKAADEAAEKGGKPRPLCHRIEGPKLDQTETLLLCALQRNKFVVEMNHTQSDRWNGDATCKFGLQEGAICIGATTRQDLLLSLWASVSGQEGDSVQLTEEHLTGSVVQAFLRAVHAQEQAL